MIKWLVKLNLLSKAFFLLLSAGRKSAARLFNAAKYVTSALNKHLTENRKAYRHFSINCLVGIVIALILHFTHHLSFISEAENLAMDLMMHVNQGTSRMSGSDDRSDHLAYTFLDIDEDTYRLWDEPFHIPRDKLKQLIEHAETGQAKAILIDVDLAKDSDDADVLIEYLKNYKEKFPPLFLLRSFYPASKFTNQDEYFVRNSMFDKIELGENIHWVQPLFKMDEYDQTVRYWHLYKVGCLDEDKPVVIPSFQLLLDVLLTHKDDMRYVETQLDRLAPETCGDINEYNLDGDLTYGSKKISLLSDEHSRIGERIIYTLPYLKKSANPREYIWQPAHVITESDSKISASSVEGRVVVIGASFKGSRDIYKTPIGTMPGAMIIMNAVKSFNAFGQTSTPGLFVKLVIELVLIVMMAFLFMNMSSFKAATVTGLLIVFLLVPISFYFFKYGVWVDFAVPLLGMQMHQIYAEYEESVRNSKNLKDTLGNRSNVDASDNDEVVDHG